MSKFNDLFRKQDSKDRRLMISKLAAIQINSIDESLKLNDLIIKEIEPILRVNGKKFNATSVNSKNHGLGVCYANAVRLIDKYNYVEGYVIRKNSKIKIAHAWNCDNAGNHFDSTLIDPEEHDYFGVIIPTSLVYKVGMRKGGVWFSTLSFLDDSELKLLD